MTADADGLQQIKDALSAADQHAANAAELQDARMAEVFAKSGTQGDAKLDAQDVADAAPPAPKPTPGYKRGGDDAPPGITGGPPRKCRRASAKAKAQAEVEED